MCLANSIFRDELRQLLDQSGMSYKEFEDGFSSFLDEKEEKLKGKKRSTHFMKYLKLVKRKN